MKLNKRLLKRRSAEMPHGTARSCMQSIILDLDCVVFDIAESMQKAFAQETGKEIPVRDWHRYQLDVIYDRPMSLLLQAIVTHQVLEQAEPDEGAAAAIHRLRNMGYHVIACTNRSFHPDAFAMTQDSLIRHGIVLDGLVINPDNHCKGLSCKSKAPDYSIFTHIIDDHCANTESALRNGVAQEGVLITRPWNRYASKGSHTMRCGSLIEFAMRV